MKRVATILLAWAAIGSAGTITALTDNSLLPDTAAWAILGPSSTSNPVSGTVTSVGGIGVTPNPPAGGALYRIDDVVGDFGHGYNFPSGDKLLYNGGSVNTKIKGNIVIDFDTLVSGVGMQFNETFQEVDEFVELDAFDSSNNLLGSDIVEYNGFASTQPIFLGLDDTVAEIASVSIGSPQGDFAIDTLNLQDTPGSGSPAPEPGAFGLLAAGLAALVYRRLA